MLRTATWRFRRRAHRPRPAAFVLLVYLPPILVGRVHGTFRRPRSSPRGLRRPVRFSPGVGIYVSKTSKYEGVKVRKCQGAKVPMELGTNVPWYQGCKVPRYQSNYFGTKVAKYLGTTVPWYQGTEYLVPRYCLPTLHSVTLKSYKGSGGSQGSY